MSSLLAPALATLLAIGFVSRTAGANIERRTILYRDMERSYFVYAPESAGENAPVLLLLHDSGSDGLWLASLWKNDADRHGIVLIAPNARHRDGWRPKEDGPDFLRAVVTAVEAEHSVDPRRLYLFGQSAGTLAAIESRWFAAVAIHAGAWRTPAEFRIVRLAQRKTPIKLIVGDRDEYFSLREVRRTEAALKADGFPVEVEIPAGQHHDYTPKIAPEVNASAWCFLAPKELDVPPVFISYRELR